LLLREFEEDPRVPPLEQGGSALALLHAAGEQEEIALATFSH
jgi:hypothetical protein